MAMAVTFREHIQIAIFENFDNCLIRKHHKDNDNDKQRTPSNGNPRKVVKFFDISEN